MTTNQPDKLDAALTRPSRVDKVFNFGYADKSSIESIFGSSTNHSLNWSSPVCHTLRLANWKITSWSHENPEDPGPVH